MLRPWQGNLAQISHTSASYMPIGENVNVMLEYRLMHADGIAPFRIAKNVHLFGRDSVYQICICFRTRCIPSPIGNYSYRKEFAQRANSFFEE